MNLVTLSINASVLLTLLLFSPSVYLLLRSSPAGFMIVLSASLLAIFRIAMNVSWGTVFYLPLSGLAVASFLLLLPAMLHASGPVTNGGALVPGMGLALAFAVDAVAVLLGVSWDPSTGLSGLFITIPTAIMMLLPLIPKSRLVTEVREARPPRWKTVLAGLSLGAWLFLEYSILSSAHAITRWNSVPLAAAGLGTVLGLLIPVASTIRPFTPPSTPVPMGVLSVLTLAAFLDYSLFHSALLPVLLLLAQATLVLGLFHTLSSLQPSSLRQKAVAVSYASLLLLLLLFASAFALAYYYVPLRSLWEGSEVVLIPAAALVVILATAALSKGFRESLKRPPLPRRLLAILIILPLIVSYVAFAPPPLQEPRPGTTLKVVTYNVHQGFNNAGMIDPEIYREILQAADADLVALQESDTARFTSANLDLVGYVASRLGYHLYYGPPTREQSFGIALLSRHEILEASYLVLTSSEDKRSLLQARIEVGGQEAWVFVTHLALGAEDREVQTREILSHISQIGGHHILAGDFNSCPGGRCDGYEGRPDDVYETVTANYVDVWTEAGFEVDDPDGFTYHAEDPRERIDYIFVSEDVEVVQAERIRTEAAIGASDHLPVLATLELGD